MSRDFRDVGFSVPTKKSPTSRKKREKWGTLGLG